MKIHEITDLVYSRIYNLGVFDSKYSNVDGSTKIEPIKKNDIYLFEDLIKLDNNELSYSKFLLSSNNRNVIYISIHLENYFTNFEKNIYEFINSLNKNPQPCSIFFDARTNVLKIHSYINFTGSFIDLNGEENIINSNNYSNIFEVEAALNLSLAVIEKARFCIQSKNNFNKV